MKTKYHRFYILDNGPAIKDLGFNKYVLLSDLVYFARNGNALDRWCEENQAHRSDMVIDFPSESVLSLFIMRWS